MGPKRADSTLWLPLMAPPRVARPVARPVPKRPPSRESKWPASASEPPTSRGLGAVGRERVGRESRQRRADLGLAAGRRRRLGRHMHRRRCGLSRRCRRRRRLWRCIPSARASTARCRFWAGQFQNPRVQDSSKEPIPAQGPLVWLMGRAARFLLAVQPPKRLHWSGSPLS